MGEESGAANFVPSYAALLRPQDFDIDTAKASRSTIEVHPKQQSESMDQSHESGDPITHSVERSFKLAHIFKTKDEWVLSGSIEVPTTSVVHSSGLDVAK